MLMLLLLLLLQHGETDMNLQGRIGGDGDLSMRGKQVRASA